MIGHNLIHHLDSKRGYKRNTCTGHVGRASRTRACAVEQLDWINLFSRVIDRNIDTVGYPIDRFKRTGLLLIMSRRSFPQAKIFNWNDRLTFQTFLEHTMRTTNNDGISDPVFDCFAISEYQPIDQLRNLFKQSVYLRLSDTSK